MEVNAFLPLPYSRITENVLLQNKVHYYQENGHFFVYGNSAEKFASLFNSEARRPMSRGLINPHEPSALTPDQGDHSGSGEESKDRRRAGLLFGPGSAGRLTGRSHLPRGSS